MSELPQGWARAEIGQLSELINGRAFKPQEWSESGLPIIRIQNLNNAAAKFNHFQGELSDRHLVRKGDLLFAWSGTPGTSFGAHIWRGENAALNQHIFKIEFDEKEIERRFFRYAINQKLEDLIGSAQGGVGLRHVTKGTFEKTLIAFPSREEQARIAQKLDSLLAQIDALKKRIDTIAPLLKRFRQSVLSAAVSGRLTESWRESNALTRQGVKSWEKTNFGAICSEITVGYVGKMADQYTEAGIPFLRSQNVRPFRFSKTNLLYVSKEFHESIAKSKLFPGDLAVVRSGAPGVTCVIPDELEVANCSDLVIARPSERLNSQFGCIFMNSEVAKRNVAENQVGVAQQHFNVGSMKQMPIELPPIEEQLEIVRRVDQLFAFADLLESKVKTAKARIGLLTQSILGSGDELREPGQTLLAGQIYNANRYCIGALLRGLGFEVHDEEVLADELVASRDALSLAASEWDALVTSGGVSVGEEDHLKRAIAELGEVNLWRLAIQPGKPFAFGSVAGKPWLGLPGNPAAALVTALLVARPFLLRQQGLFDVVPRPLALPAAFDWPQPRARRQYLRARLDERGRVEIHPQQGSAMLLAASWADGLAVIERGATLGVGDAIDFLPFSALMA
ncbi:restriction endonuclease subunit S [Pseudomonas aeruginosa]|nr:restriction endonuclease subunit S [Pseudomonas aeruginosa]